MPDGGWRELPSDIRHPASAIRLLQFAELRPAAAEAADGVAGNAEVGPGAAGGKKRADLAGDADDAAEAGRDAGDPARDHDQHIEAERPGQAVELRGHALEAEQQLAVLVGAGAVAGRAGPGDVGQL